MPQLNRRCVAHNELHIYSYIIGLSHTGIVSKSGCLACATALHIHTFEKTMNIETQWNSGKIAEASLSLGFVFFIFKIFSLQDNLKNKLRHAALL